MDFNYKLKSQTNKEINTMQLLGISISCMTLLLSTILSFTGLDPKDIIIIVSIFILGLTVILSYIAIGTRIENSAGEITSLIIILTTLSNMSIFLTPDLRIYFLLVLVPLILVGLYLFENRMLRKIFFLNIMTIIVLVKMAPLLFPKYLPRIIDYFQRYFAG